MPASAITSAGAGDRHGGGENLRAVGIRGPHGEQAIFLGAHGARWFRRWSCTASVAVPLRNAVMLVATSLFLMRSMPRANSRRRCSIALRSLA